MKSCHGKLYFSKAKECQICEFSESCWKALPVVNRPMIRTGYGIAILNIIFSRKRITVGELKKELSRRFNKRDVNIYYHLTILKDQQMIDMKIEGRKRYYVLK